MLDEPLDFGIAKALIRSILADGQLRVSAHALDELEKDGLQEVDAVNVLRAGLIEGCDFERGSWRYRVRTPRITVVIAFRSETALVVVTGWRN